MTFPASYNYLDHDGTYAAALLRNRTIDLTSVNEDASHTYDVEKTPRCVLLILFYNDLIAGFSTRIFSRIFMPLLANWIDIRP
jgi:hypothetical protein